MWATDGPFDVQWLSGFLEHGRPRQPPLCAQVGPTPEKIPQLSRAASSLVGSELHVFGGLDERTKLPTDAMWSLDLNLLEWHLLDSGGNKPSPRIGHALCSLGSAIFAFGGLAGDRHSAEFAQYDAAAMLWEVPQLDGAAPGARVGHTMVSSGSALYIYGGASGGRPLNEVYTLDLSRSYWERAVMADPRAEGPPALVGHVAVVVEIAQQGQLAKDNVANVGKKMLVFGGGDGRKAGNDTLMIDLETLATHKLETRGTAPLARVGHACALVRSQQLFVFGGFVRKLGYMFDMHMLNLEVQHSGP